MESKNQHHSTINKEKIKHIFLIFHTHTKMSRFVEKNASCPYTNRCRPKDRAAMNVIRTSVKIETIGAMRWIFGCYFLMPATTAKFCISASDAATFAAAAAASSIAYKKQKP